MTCNFCNLTTSGGIIRERRHQLGITGDVVACFKTPPDVKTLLHADLVEKERIKKRVEEMLVQIDEDINNEIEEIGRI